MDMHAETKVQISKLLYQLSTEDRAAADRTLKEIVKNKVDRVFNMEYQKVKNTFSKEK